MKKPTVVSIGTAFLILAVGYFLHNRGASGNAGASHQPVQQVASAKSAQEPVETASDAPTPESLNTNSSGIIHLEGLHSNVHIAKIN